MSAFQANFPRKEVGSPIQVCLERNVRYRGSIRPRHILLWLLKQQVGLADELAGILKECSSRTLRELSTKW